MQLMSSLQLEAYNYIKNLILSHKLDANTLYSETKLSKELGISRTPMREALQCLSQDGYITVIPSKGFRIRQRRNGLALRIVGDTLPEMADACSNDIDLEDVYLYYFGDGNS